MRFGFQHQRRMWRFARRVRRTLQMKPIFDEAEAAREYYGPQAPLYTRRITCPECQGGAYVMRSVCDLKTGLWTEDEVVCPECNGKGELTEEV